MKAVFIAAALILPLWGRALDYAAPGPCAVGWSQVEIPRTNATAFSAWIFYPATAGGFNTLPDYRDVPRPAVSFGHGFLCPPSLYTGTMRHLASWGMVVIATESGLELFPDHRAYADDMRACLRWLRSESGKSGGFWSGFISSENMGVSGHSMGGGAALLAAADDPSITAAGTLAPAETRPSAVDAISEIRSPVLIVAGSQDRITPPSWHALPMYGNAKAPKILSMLPGGSHCGFVDVPLPDAVCDEGLMPRPVQLDRSRAALTAFFRAYLMQDSQAADFIWGGGMELNPSFGVTADPGFSLGPFSQLQAVGPGQFTTFQLAITNHLDVATRFSMRNGPGNALTANSTITTALLPPGGTTTVFIQIGLPSDQRTAWRVVKTGFYPDATPEEDIAVLTLRRAAVAPAIGRDAPRSKRTVRRP